MSACCLVPRLLNSKVGCEGFKKYWVSILGLSGVAPEFQSGGRWGGHSFAGRTEAKRLF